MAKKSTFLQHFTQKVEKKKLETTIQEVGVIKEFGDNVAIIEGLENTQMGELLTFENGTAGLTLNLEKDHIGCVVLGETKGLSAGQTVQRTEQILSIGVSDEIIGRVVDPLGNALDGKPAIKVEKYQPLEKVAPGVIERQSVSEPLQTGLKSVDSLIPIGRGQRELIIGDRSTGKSAIALGTILHQKPDDVMCVYVAIGQKRSFLAQTIGTLEKHNAMDYSVIVNASASDPASMQYLAPYAGIAIAEYFLNQGKDVLIIYDDLSKHAQAYREISLLLRRPSGREAYPGDVFYLHSRLLERACRLNKDYGGGSITALPIIETQGNDVSAYIPTNVISITDGQIYLEPDLFNAGQRPAINIGISVSRVGSSAQIKAMKQVAGSLKLDLSQFRELEAFAQFGGSDLDDKTKKQLNRGRRVNEILKQGWDEPMDVEKQVAVIFAATKGYLDEVRIENVQQWENAFLEFLASTNILQSIQKEQKLTEKTEKQLIQSIESFNQAHGEWLTTQEEDKR